MPAFRAFHCAETSVERLHKLFENAMPVLYVELRQHPY